MLGIPMTIEISQRIRRHLLTCCAAPLLMTGLAEPASTQTATPAAETVAPPAAASTAAVIAPQPLTPAAAATEPKATKPTPAKARECTRLPLSDIKGGKENTIASARLRLDEYIAQVGQKRGWKSWDKSLETVECNEFLWVPIIGQEYKCKVTATFCKKS